MARFAAVAALAEEMANTASRLAKRAAIAAAVGAVRDEELRLFCLYLAGLPFAEADPRKLNAGGALLSKALLNVSGATEAELSVAYRRHGDMGSAAFDLLEPTSQKRDVGHPLQLCDVEEAFAGMATAKTTAIRAALVEELLRRASALEAKYLLKLMLGDMRIGVKQSLVEEAIAVAAGADVAAVRHAVMLEADLGAAAERAFAGTLAEARMRLFHPLGFMLASPVETPEEAVERFTAKPVKVAAEKKSKRRKKADAVMEDVLEADVEAAMLEEGSIPTSGEEPPDMGHPVEAFLEDKYDGMRAQVHCGASYAAGRVAIYSRNREDITESFPELVEAFAAVTTADGAGLIFDGEILGWDFTTGQALPFAVLGQRIGRKRVGNEMRQQVPVVFMAFDLMFAGGDLLLGLPLRERRNRLEAEVERLVEMAQSPLILREKPAQASIFADEHPTEPPQPRLMLSPSRLVASAEEIDRAYADARARANEGVMLKAANSVYQPGRRGLAWVKLKRELATLDVVITGAEWGHGRKSPFLSDYTFAVQDAAGELKNVGKAYSGVTDAEIAELTEWIKAHTLEDFGHFRTVEPLVILEVAFNNIMRSDRHVSGFALRFPRILRIRTDKPLAEIDTVERVEEIYQSQVDKPQEQTTPGRGPDGKDGQIPEKTEVWDENGSGLI
jgi:DNA ligase-1